MVTSARDDLSYPGRASSSFFPEEFYQPLRTVLTNNTKVVLRSLWLCQRVWKLFAPEWTESSTSHIDLKDLLLSHHYCLSHSLLGTNKFLLCQCVTSLWKYDWHLANWLDDWFVTETNYRLHETASKIVMKFISITIKVPYFMWFLLQIHCIWALIGPAALFFPSEKNSRNIFCEPCKKSSCVE